jgi:hypothetical protein
MAPVFELAAHLVNKPSKTCMVRHVFGIYGKSSFQAHFGPVLQLCSPLRRPEVGPVCVDSRVEFEVLTCGGSRFPKANSLAHLVNAQSLKMA